jgi:hypothetical protein
MIRRRGKCGTERKCLTSLPISVPIRRARGGMPAWVLRGGVRKKNRNDHPRHSTSPLQAALTRRKYQEQWCVGHHFYQQRGSTRRQVTDGRVKVVKTRHRKTRLETAVLRRAQRFSRSRATGSSTWDQKVFSASQSVTRVPEGSGGGSSRGCACGEEEACGGIVAGGWREICSRDRVLLTAVSREAAGGKKLLVRRVG